MKPDSEKHYPIIFLVGPPGAGKSRLGEKACRELDLRFLDLSTPEINQQPLQSQKDILAEAIDKRSAEIMALPWTLQQDKGTRKFLRRSGVLLLLWAHPLDMQARSGHSEPLFTPAPRIKTRGGFGRNGTGCREFRRLDQASDEVLLLVNSSLDEAVDELKDCIIEFHEENSEPPIIRAGVDDWIEDWSESYDIGEDITAIIVGAMARYILHLRSEGKSPRYLSGIYSDLQAAGMLVISYDYPEGKNAEEVLELFSSPPWTIEFRRKFSDSPNAVARYERNLEGFARFLENNQNKWKEWAQ